MTVMGMTDRFPPFHTRRTKRPARCRARRCWATSGPTASSSTRSVFRAFLSMLRMMDPTHADPRTHTQADGIDGKTGIKLLVDMIKAPLASASKGDGSKGHKRTAAEDGSPSVPPLTRPLICICNDLYAPQLRGAYL